MSGRVIVFVSVSSVCSGQQFSVAAPCCFLSGSSAVGGDGSSKVEYVPGYDKVKELQQSVCAFRAVQ